MLQQALGNMADLRTALSAKDAATVLNPFQRAVWRAASDAARGSPGLVQQRGEQILAALAAVRRSVTLITPPNGTYTLASASAPLVFTVQNDLDVTVNVRVLVRRGTAGLAATDEQVHPVQPKSRTTITVPAKVERSGSFTIQTGIATPGGQSLGRPVQIVVRSTAYGSAALIVTGAAFALLLALFARRGVRRLRARRTPPAGPGDPDDRADASVFEAVR